MKSSTKNMTFRIWFYFLVLTGVMLLFLWMLQVSFIGPYYERNRAQMIQSKVSEIERIISKDDDSSKWSSLISKTLMQENMCGAIYNEQGNRIVMSSDTGNSCQISNLSPSAVAEYMKMAQKSGTSDFSVRFNNDIFEQGMYFYGKKTTIKTTVSELDYYIFINTPIELLDSTVYVLRRQFGLIAMVVFSFATIVTFVLSRRLSRPIVNITVNASKLARGDLSVSFDETEYTEVEALSNSLNYATKEFRKTDELRRDLVANVSHDIKTPLTMIKAYAEMIQDISGNDPEMREKHLSVIIDEANHLERLVNDMLTLSKFESKVFDVKESVFNLKEHVENTVNLLQGMGIDFKVDVPETMMVEADEIKMGQVLYNYLNNATKYAADSGSVEVYAKHDKNKVTIYVQDHGPGIEPEVIEHIWDRYYKIDKNFQRTSSSGLGLSIVRAICDATGSDYGVTSELNKGTTFYYTLRKVTTKEKR